LLVALSIVACSAPTALPTPVPALPTPLSEMAPVAPTPTSARAPQEVRATPTPFPAEEPGPELISLQPEPGQELALDGQVTLEFDQEMDRASVEQAVSIAPAAPLSFEWRDGRTLVIGSQGGAFAPDTEYELVVARTALSSAGVPLARPMAWPMETTGVASIAQMTPAPDSTDVAVAGPLRVVFDRPVVPLVGVQEQASLPAPVDITPSIEGVGAWVNTSVYEFSPALGWEGGLRYTVETVSNPGQPIVATIASEKWSFTTALPRVIDVSPAQEAQFVDPASDVRLTFNQPMALDETARLLVVRNAATGRAVTGDVTWEENTLVFVPADPLARGATFEIDLAAGAPAASGDTAIETAYGARFRVAPPLSLEGSLPRTGAKDFQADAGVRLNFSCPIDRDSLMKTLRVEPKAEFYVWTDDLDSTAHVSLGVMASTPYKLIIGADLQDQYGESLGKDVEITFTTAPRRPAMWLLTPGPAGVYDAYAEPVVYASIVNVASAAFELFEIGESGFVSLMVYGGWPDWDKFAPPADSLLRQWTVRSAGKLNETVTLKAELAGQGKKLEPGYYVLRATAAGATAVGATLREHHLLVVTPFSLVFKTGGDQGLVWATDLRTGLPAANLDLSVYDENSKRITSARTDGDGIATMDIGKRDPWSGLTVTATRGADTGAVLRIWSDGIAPWSFDVPVEMYTEAMRVFAFSDRRIYRPGQTVYYKGFVRADDDGTYSLPETGLPMQIEVHDSQGRTILQDKLVLSENGSFDGAILLSEDASLGYYYATFKIGEQYADLSFLVAEYRKPEFQGAMTLDRTDYVPGDTVAAEVSVSYFFGGAVSGGQVHWTAYKEPYVPFWQGLEAYSFDDYDINEWPYVQDYGGPVGDGSGETDEDGRFVIELPVDLSEDIGSRRLVLQASVIDANNQEVAVTGGAVLHKASVYAGLGSDAYIGAAGEEMVVKLITVDTQGRPLPRQDVTVTFLKHESYSVQEQAENGRSYWVNKTRETEVSTASVTTNADGLATASFQPTEGGAYRVRTAVRDAQANESHSSLYLWVSDSGFVNWGQSNDNRMQLIADKDRYEVGDVARVLVPAPFDVPTQALLTIERGSVIEHTLLTFDGASKIIEVPIIDDYVPDVFVSVTMIAGSQDLQAPANFKVGYVELPVDTSTRELTVTIEPSQTTYKPRDEAEFNITTKDASGQPVSAEVSLLLVDLAVETLLGGELPDILNAFYRERGLGVTTAASLTISVDRVNLEYAKEGKGGGGGGGDEGGAAREFFPDTAYWRATLVTDQTGQARVTVLLPDNLTTWRMKAQAMSLDSLVGSAQTDVMTNLDLMVRPALPRFFVAGDEPELSAVVHNNTSRSLTVDVKLDARQVEVENAAQTVTIPALGKATVIWPARVVGNDAATFSVSAQGGGLTDTVRIELPILRPISPEVVATSGQVDDRIAERVQVPIMADEDWGALVVLLEPSLAAGMAEGLRYLEHYPYDCAEQTISRFYPNVVTYQALAALGIDRRDLTAKLPQQVGVGLQRLYQTQNFDGGWGWWARESSNPTLTAYAVTALATASEAGFAVDDNALSLATGFLRARLDEKPVDARYDRDERAAVLYALAMAGDGDLGRTVNLYDERDDVSLYTRAYLTMTLAMLDQPGSTRLQTLINELEQAAIVTGTTAHWEEAEESPWNMTTDTRTTAMIVRALVQVAPDSKTLPAAVRWLMTARSAARWETTQENVWAIVALTDYMVATGELQGNYDYDVALNGRTLEAGAVTPATVDQVMVQQVAMPDLEREALNTVALSRSDGPGKLYYSAYLNYYLPVERMHPLARGIYVQREYTFLDAAGKPSERAVLNGLVQVKLTLIAPTNLYYLVIEDALPAGCEAIDPALDISRRVDQAMGLAPVGDPPWDEPLWRQYWPTHTEFRDERVALFATELARGTYEYTYTLRCSAPGRFNVLPALAYQMYAPDVMGRSAGEQLLIER
jgi:uncharacterized protein YfaS (alpha-2-macroglobulin family)